MAEVIFQLLHLEQVTSCFTTELGILKLLAFYLYIHLVMSVFIVFEHELQLCCLKILITCGIIHSVLTLNLSPSYNLGD